MRRPRKLLRREEVCDGQLVWGTREAASRSLLGEGGTVENVSPVK